MDKITGIFKARKPLGDCPLCPRTNVKMCKGVCTYCYMAEYTRKRNEEREPYRFDWRKMTQK